MREQDLLFLSYRRNVTICPDENGQVILGTFEHLNLWPNTANLDLVLRLPREELHLGVVGNLDDLTKVLDEQTVRGGHGLEAGNRHSRYPRGTTVLVS